MDAQLDAAIEKDLAKQQSLAGKQAAWSQFLSRLRGTKPANTIGNFTFLIGELEKSGRFVTPENLHKALSENLDYLPDGYDKSAQVAAEQQAQRDAASKESAALNAWFERAQAEHGYVDDQHNRSLLVEYLEVHFRGVPSEVALTAFLRENADNPNVHRLAQPASKTLIPDEMWAKQNVLRNPAREREEAEAAAAEKRKRFDQSMNDAKTRATFEGELKSIRGYREMHARGINWAQTWSIQRDRMTALLQKYPQYAAEIQQAISKIGK